MHFASNCISSDKLYLAINFLFSRLKEKSGRFCSRHSNIMAPNTTFIQVKGNLKGLQSQNLNCTMLLHCKRSLLNGNRIALSAAKISYLSL